MRNRFIESLLAASLLWTLGCSPSSNMVEGSVTLNNNSVPSGTISFEPVDAGGNAFDGTIKDGHYRLAMPADDATKTYIVRITSLQPTGRKVSPGPPSPPGAVVDEIADVVPARYNTSSILKIDLSSGDSRDFKLTTSSP